MSERFVVTGAMGCIGAWVVCNLVREGVAVSIFDLDSEPRRLRLLLTEEELGRVEFIRGDITDLGAFEAALDKFDVNRVIHLAALQVPFCKADPPLGARVNVVGTVNVFEAVQRRRERIPHVVYASSMAVFGAPEDYEPDTVLADETDLVPHTHYGVYKQANEGTARIYSEDAGVPSIALRPYVIYGVARDQGLTSMPTTAMLAAAVDRPCHIPYGGRMVFQHADDTAKAFIRCARVKREGAAVFNLSGPAPDMSEVVGAINKAAPASTGKITFDDVPFPIPADVESRGLEQVLGKIPHRPLQQGVAETIAKFRELVDRKQIDPDSYLKGRTA